MGRSILVVDDQRLMRDLMRQVLTDDGHRVHLAESANDGLVQARTLNLDLVILDGHLPGGNGWDVMRTLRQEFPDRPVIMVTGDAPNEEWQRFTNGDPGTPFDILEKPFEISLFRDAVGRALEAAGGTAS